MPPRSRLPTPVDEHFRQQQALYVRDRSKLDRIDVRPIKHTIELATDYVLKSVRRRRFTTDDVLLLPRALAEVRDRFHNPVIMVNTMPRSNAKPTPTSPDFSLLKAYPEEYHDALREYGMPPFLAQLSKVRTSSTTCRP